jgi:putative polyhydroxyalkanoate system protein
MSKITIHRPHHLSHKKAKEVAESLALDLQEKFSLRYAWVGDHLEFNRPGVTGRLRVGPGELEMHVELGFLLAAFRQKIEAEIHRELDELLKKEERPRHARPAAVHVEPAGASGGGATGKPGAKPRPKGSRDH